MLPLKESLFLRSCVLDFEDFFALYSPREREVIVVNPISFRGFPRRGNELQTSAARGITA